MTDMEIVGFVIDRTCNLVVALAIINDAVQVDRKVTVAIAATHLMMPTQCVAEFMRNDVRVTPIVDRELLCTTENLPPHRTSCHLAR